MPLVLSWFPTDWRHKRKYIWVIFGIWTCITVNSSYGIEFEGRKWMTGLISENQILIFIRVICVTDYPVI